MPPPLTYSDPTFYWKDNGLTSGFAPETITATAALYTDPAGALSQNPVLPADAYIGTVTATKTVNVWTPNEYDTPVSPANGGVLTNTPNPQFGTVGIDAGNNHVVSNDPSGNPEGFSLSASVVTPDFFSKGGTSYGGWAFLQTCQLNVTQGGGINPSQMTSPQLDSSFPYDIHADTPNGIPGIIFDAEKTQYGNINYQALNDHPDEGWTNFPFPCTAFAFNNHFNTYVMYQPPNTGYGINWVPLDLYAWGYSASITRPNSNSPWSPTALGPVTNGGKTPNPHYPTWSDKFSP